MKKIGFLQQTGLNENESLVYETLLENGKLPVASLIRITRLKRGNLYNILYSLESKNLIEEFVHEKKKHFRLLSPKKLREFVVEKRNNLRRVTAKIDSELPTLLKLFQTSSEKPGVYYYDGIEGLKSVYERIIKEKKDLCVFVSNFERKDPEVDKMLNKQIKRQYKAGIKIRALSAHNYKKRDLDSLHRHNSYPKVVDGMKLDSEILLFGGNAALTTFKKDYFTTLIINDQIAQTVRCIFEIMYLNAKDPKITKDDERKIKIN